MKLIKEISKQPWDYTLYQQDDQFILTVVFFAQIDYPRSFTINKIEASGNLQELSQKIRDNYCCHEELEIKPPITRASTIS